MTKRALAILAVLVAAAVVAGCGSSSGSGNAVEDALTFMPKDAPIVATLATDPDGGQWKQLDELASKFPFAGQLKQRFKDSVDANSSLSFDDDIKPILGNEAVIAVPTPDAARADGNNAMFALEVDDEGAAEDFVKKDATKVSTVEGTDVYKERSGTLVALKDGVIVAAPTLPVLQDALRRHGGEDHMTPAEFDARLAGLKGDGLLKLGINAQQLLTTAPDAGTKKARRVKWVGALRDVGFMIAAKPDGVEFDFKSTSTGGLSDRDLPLAAGAEAAPIVRRANEFGFGIRNPAQIIQFGQSARGATDPAAYGRYQARKAKAGVKLGIDIDRDVFSQFVGDASVSVGIDGSFAVRSDLRDAAAFQRTLRTAAPKLPKVSKDEHVQVVVPPTQGGLYTATSSTGKRYAFGVVGDRFVLATDEARAQQFAGQSASAVPGVKGSVTMAADARSLANAAAQRAGQGAAGLFTGALGDFIGSVDSETSGLTGHFKLQIK